MSQVVQSEWRFDLWEVVRTTDRGELWHITGRWQDEDTGRRQYFLEDMTWTAGEYRDAEHLEDRAERTGHRIESTKPATQIGYRVNGLLVGPDYAPEKLERDREKGRGCMHDVVPCPNCGEEDSENIDIVTTPSTSDESNATWCRICGHLQTFEWEHYQ